MKKSKFKRNFLIPRDGFFDFAVEFTAAFYKNEAIKVSVSAANDFIDKFLEKHFTDYDEEDGI